MGVYLYLSASSKGQAVRAETTSTGSFSEDTLCLTRGESNSSADEVTRKLYVTHLDSASLRHTKWLELSKCLESLSLERHKGSAAFCWSPVRMSGKGREMNNNVSSCVPLLDSGEHPMAVATIRMTKFLRSLTKPHEVSFASHDSGVTFSRWVFPILAVCIGVVV
ncbi:uncharacterized protein UDID_18004 [Ustilago sp. UG-2017a]|nr:uncharacterized protein UDID_18004 [Ustilago sp. UG-2017a]